MTKMWSNKLNPYEKLILFPEMGREVPEKKNTQIRQINLSPYRIIYRFDNDIVLITTIKQKKYFFNCRFESLMV